MQKRLQPYRRKRHFQITPEPSPRTPARPQAAGATFVVHKHDARRLHYDLRLEMDGALASWAIPKGPSYDPGEKRLAVQTEDHPLAYAGFEGRIPEGEYGAGDSLVWDRGTWETIPPGQGAAMRRHVKLVFQLHGEKLRGRWHLVRTRPRGGKEQWLLIKGRDAYSRGVGDIVAERPESVVSGRRVTRGPVRRKDWEAPHPRPVDLLLRVWPAMLATLTRREEVGDERYVCEVKYDGFRALAALSGGKVTLQSRTGNDLATRFPTVVAAVANVPQPELVLDGEIIATDRRGLARFQNLQAGTGELRYAVFDLLWLNGEDLRSRGVEERRELLEGILAGAPPPLALAERIPGSIDPALGWAHARHHEGIVLKRAGSPYVGERSLDWLKLKLLQSQEVALVGYVPISNGTEAIGALVLAVYDKGRFRYAGKVGTGFTNKVRADLWRMLRAIEVERPTVPDPPGERDVHWVRPKYVAQIAFSEWTRDGKLRQPSFQGLRDDKRPEECVCERPRHLRRGSRR
jgi:bifunctional non-homologous end joining protein LigD